MRKRHTELSVGAERRWGKGALPSAGEENRFLRWDEVKDVGLVGRAGREGVGRGQCGSGEMAHSIKWLSSTHEDLSLDPRHSHL